MSNHTQRPLVAAIEDRVSDIDPAAWVAPTASVEDEIVLGPVSSVWYGAVLRAVDEEVNVGRGSDTQDDTVLHADLGFPCRVGDDVTVGNGAIVHGARSEAYADIARRHRRCMEDPVPEGGGGD